MSKLVVWRRSRGFRLAVRLIWGTALCWFLLLTMGAGEVSEKPLPLTGTIHWRAWAALPRAKAVVHAATLGDSSVDRDATVSMAYNPHLDELDVVYTKLNEATDRREVWFKSVAQGDEQNSQIGFCVKYDCPVSIAVDPRTHLPAVAYRYEDRGLILAQLENGDWISETVSASTGNWNNSLAFDPADSRPAIAYNSIGDYNLLYAKSYGSGWGVDLLSYLDASFESLRFHPATGQRHISFQTLGWTDRPSRLYHYELLSGVNSKISYVDGGFDYVGGGNSLAFDRAGNPHISYFDHTNERLRHAWRDGKVWSIDVVDDDVQEDGVTSLAISSDDKIYISYTKRGQGELGLASFVGGSWRTRIIAQSEDRDISKWSSVALDDEDRVYVAYVSGGQAHVIDTGAELVYLPLVYKSWLQVPYKPSLYAIGDVDSFCDEYEVMWVEYPECLADKYVLQKANDPGPDADWSQVCETDEQTCWVNSRPAGVYYYRVQGQNIWGSSEWSNVEKAETVPHSFDPTSFSRREYWDDFYRDIRGSYVRCGGGKDAHYVYINDLTDYVLEMTFQGGDGKCAQLYFKDSNWRNVYSKCIKIKDGKPIRFDPKLDSCDVCEFIDFSNIYAVGAQIGGGIQGVELTSARLVLRE